jgi:hypothetical protein
MIATQRTGDRLRRLTALALLLLASPAPLFAQYSYITNNNSITITGYDCSAGVITIPDTINGLPVTQIGITAFANCATLTGVVISSNVTSIGVDAFFLCTNLTTITVDANNPAYSSTDGVLFADNQTMLVVYPLGKLGSYTVPNTVRSLADHAFYNCTHLTRVTMPNGLADIGTYAFCYCSGLINVAIPASVTNIGLFAFGYCPNLAGIYFWSNAPPVGSYAFSGASKVTAYYLPGTTGWSYFSAIAGIPVVLWNPQTTSLGVQNNQFEFNVTGTTNIPVVVEACTNLASSVWSPLQSFTLTNGLVAFHDLQWTNYHARFYRLNSP